MGLIVVNIAAFIVQHLYEFRWTITILAFVSGLMLDSWTAVNMYRVLRQRFPHHAWVQEHNQSVVLMAGMLFVIVASAVTALFCYRGLNEQNLPNVTTFVTGVVAIVVPIVLQAFFGQRLGDSGDRTYSDGGGAFPRSHPGP